FHSDRNAGGALHSEELASPGVERIRPCYRVRPVIPSGVLRRSLLVLCRALRAEFKLGFGARTGAGEPCRHRDYDDGCLLHLLVQEAGQAAVEGAKTSGRLLARRGFLSKRAPCASIAKLGWG